MLDGQDYCILRVDRLCGTLRSVFLFRSDLQESVIVVVVSVEQPRLSFVLTNNYGESAHSRSPTSL